MRRALVLLTLVLAGCISAPAPGPLDHQASLAPAAALPVSGAPFTMLLCGDALQELLGDHRDGCNAQVTKENGPAAEVSLAVNPRDPLNLVGGAKDFSLGADERCGVHNVWSGVYWTRDGGRTWGNTFLPGHPKDERKTPLSEYACGSDPVLAFGPDGTAYYASIHSTTTGGDKPPLPQLGPLWGGSRDNAALAVSRSHDGGEHWDDAVLLQTRVNQGILDKEWLAVDPATGQLYVSYIDTGVGIMFVQRSDDQGATWTEPVEVARNGEGMGGPDIVQFGQVAVGPGSVVHFTYWALRQGGDVSGVYHRASKDAGASWTEPVQAGNFAAVFDLQFTHKYRIVTNPALAVDARSGALYLAYPNPAEVGALASNLDIYVVRSTDEGASWSMPARVNDDLLPTNGQWMPALAVGPDGAVHATWLDYRDDPSGQSAAVYYAFSTDGGATWSKNARVGDVLFDGTGGYHQSGSGTIGDYMGLAVSEQAVHPFWADTRHGRNDVFAAIIPAR